MYTPFALPFSIHSHHPWQIRHPHQNPLSPPYPPLLTRKTNVAPTPDYLSHQANMPSTLPLHHGVPLSMWTLTKIHYHHCPKRENQPRALGPIPIASPIKTPRRPSTQTLDTDAETSWHAKKPKKKIAFRHLWLTQETNLTPSTLSDEPQNPKHQTALNPLQTNPTNTKINSSQRRPQHKQKTRKKKQKLKKKILLAKISNLDS